MSQSPTDPPHEPVSTAPQVQPGQPPRPELPAGAQPRHQNLPDSAPEHGRAAALEPEPPAAPAARPGTAAGATRWSRLLRKLDRLKGVAVAIAGLGAVLSGLVGYWTTYQAARVAVAPISANATPAPAGALSILVLPLTNQTGDPQKDYLTEALTNSITSDLLRIRDGFVVPASSAAAYRNQSVTVQQVGKAAGVRFVLQGSVLSGGDTIRVSLQLADAQSGVQLWSDSTEGAVDNLFALQDQVTTRFGNSIGREMVIAAARDSEARKDRPSVPDLMLRARALGLKPQSQQINQQLEDLYRQVLALEPDNARAMVGLATAIGSHLGNFGSAMAVELREQLYLQGRDLVLKAKELDPDNPGVYAVLLMYTPSDDLVAYRAAAENWLSHDTKNPNAYVAFALSFLLAAEPARAIELLNRAINLDARHPGAFILMNMGRAHFMQGNNAAAIGWYQKALQANPLYAHAHAYLAMAFALDGQDDKARAAVEELHRVDPEYKFFAITTLSPSSPPAFKEYWDKMLLPAARKAGLSQ